MNNNSSVNFYYNDIALANGVTVNGANNINFDPLFVNALLYDYNLTYNSPCIDAGDPFGQVDPDGSTADLGAYYYYHAIDFDSDIRFITPGSMVQFNSLTEGHNSPITAYSWDFGDLGTSTDENPSYVYDTTGLYTVILQVTTGNFLDEKIRENFIVVHPEVIPAPGNVNISLIDSDVLITWNQVNITESLRDSIVSNYLVYCCDSPDGIFTYLAQAGDQTEYLHQGIANEKDQQYYFIVAHVGNERSLREYLNNNRTMRIKNGISTIEKNSKTNYKK